MSDTRWTTAQWNAEARKDREEERRANSTFYAILLRGPNSTEIHTRLFRDEAEADAEAARMKAELVYHAEMSGASTWGVDARVYKVVAA